MNNYNYNMGFVLVTYFMFPFFCHDVWQKRNEGTHNPIKSKEEHKFSCLNIILQVRLEKLYHMYAWHNHMLSCLVFCMSFVLSVNSCLYAFYGKKCNKLCCSKKIKHLPYKTKQIGISQVVVIQKGLIGLAFRPTLTIVITSSFWFSRLPITYNIDIDIEIIMMKWCDYFYAKNNFFFREERNINS